MRENYYLDNAATTWPKPETVYVAIDRFCRSSGVNPGRTGYEMAVECETMIFQTRRMLKDFFGFAGKPERVAFSLNATDSLNTALFGLLNEGDHVISTRLEHNSVLRPLNHLSRDGGVSVTLVGRDGQGYVDPDDIKAAITPRTKMVVVNHASNVLGSIQDLEAIGRIVGESDAVLVVDACQTAGVIPIEMDDLGIDVLAFTGHKALFGPMGIGGMIVREGVDIRAPRVGGTGVDSISAFHPSDYPHHLEAGTVSLPGITGLNAAQKWFAELGQQGKNSAEGLSHKEACHRALAQIRTKELGHIGRLESALRDLEGVTVLGPTGNKPRVATLSVVVDGLPADQVGNFLDSDHHVCVRTGLHCAPLVHEDQKTIDKGGAVRFAIGYFNDAEDIDQAVAGMTEIAAFARSAAA